MTTQHLEDKKYQYFGSNRFFAVEQSLGSTSAYTFITFSGTNSGFLAEGLELSQRTGVASSGTSVAEITPFSGGQVLPIYGRDALVFDGLNLSGLWIRSNAASQVIRITAW